MKDLSKSFYKKNYIMYEKFYSIVCENNDTLLIKMLFPIIRKERDRLRVKYCEINNITDWMNDKFFVFHCHRTNK